MLIIESLNKKSSKAQSIIQAVANIESLVQPQDPWDYQALKDLLEQDSMQLLIIKNDLEKALGYCLYQHLFEQAEILRIGTHPDYQRQGIASQLFAKLNKQLEALKVESLLLEVRADNTPAIALYQKQQFCIIHRRKRYYQMAQQPAIDALIMQLTFKKS